MSGLLSVIAAGGRAGRMLLAILRAGREIASARAEAVRGFESAVLDMGFTKDVAEDLSALYPRLDIPTLPPKRRREGAGVADIAGTDVVDDEASRRAAVHTKEVTRLWPR